MKKFAVVLLVLGAVFALTQCELFGTTVTYQVSGSGFGTVPVLYNDEHGERVEENVGLPWDKSFTLFSSKLPFVAALRVTNNSGDFVDAYIREDGVDVDWITNIPNLSSSNLYAWIE